MSKMKDQAIFAALSLFAAACGYHSPHFDPDPTSLHNGVNAYEPQKLTGFTQITGRRRWSKKQRKQQRKQQLKNRKK